MSTYLPINLPSRCLVYYGVKQDDVKIRAYQGQDEVYLSQINPKNLEKNYFEVLHNLIQGVDPLKLTLGDRMYIIIWECINSYSNLIKVNTICSHCLNEEIVSVDLSNFDVTELPKDFEQPYTIDLSTGEKIRLQLLTVADDIKTEQYSVGHEDSMLYRYARSVVTDADILQTLEQFRSLPAKDFLRIVAWHEKFFHGPVMESAFTCSKCDKEDKVEVPFRFSFFFPDGSELEEFFGQGI